jgi:hypothetical protein
MSLLEMSKRPPVRNEVNLSTAIMLGVGAVLVGE